MRKQYTEGSNGRAPRTTQERRATPKKCQWGRRGRNINNLPNTYDDIGVGSKKSWKHKRLKQYHVGGRGKKHTLYIPEGGRCYRLYLVEWDLQCYFREHNIPFNIVADREQHTRVEVITHQQVYMGCETHDRYGNKYFWPKSIYEVVELKKPIVRKHSWSTTKGYYINFWTNKQLDLSQFGVDYV